MFSFESFRKEEKQPDFLAETAATLEFVPVAERTQYELLVDLSNKFLEGKFGN